MFLNVILISYFLKNFSYELIIEIKKKRKNIARLHVSSLFRKMWSSSAYGLSFYLHFVCSSTIFPIILVLSRKATTKSFYFSKTCFPTFPIFF